MLLLFKIVFSQKLRIIKEIALSKLACPSMKEQNIKILMIQCKPPYLHQNKTLALRRSYIFPK